MRLLGLIKKTWKKYDLLWFLVKLDLKAFYKPKLLGYFWTILDPLMMMIVYVILVQYIFRKGNSQFPILLFSALLPWKWFTYSIHKSATSLTGKAKLIQTIAFPKVIFPIQQVITGLIKYLLSLGALFPLLFIFKANLTLNLLWLPLIIFIQFLFTLGLAILFSIIGVYFRDLPHILQFSLRIWLYLSPILYSVSFIPKPFRLIYMLNPFAALLNSYKNILVRGSSPSSYIWVVVIIGVFFLFFGLWMFNKKEKDLVKNV